MEITKEQVLELKKLGNLGTLYKLKEWFPEAFKLDFEVGKWYCHDKSKSIVNYQGGSTGYGFSALKNWAPLGYKISWSFKTLTHEWRLATTEEWESALIAEAKKRGYKNGNYKCLCQPSNTTKNIETHSYYISGDCVWFGSGENGNQVFNDGVWAEIIKTFSKEEAEKLLGGKII
jgi:hypothetical protein